MEISIYKIKESQKNDFKIHTRRKFLEKIETYKEFIKYFKKEINEMPLDEMNSLIKLIFNDKENILISDNEDLIFSEILNEDINEFFTMFSWKGINSDEKNTEWDLLSKGHQLIEGDFGEIDEVDINLKTIKKKPDVPYTIFEMEVNNSLYVIAFGQSYNLALKFADNTFPIKFINSFEDKTFSRTDIIYPFSRTNKVIQNHKDVKNYINKMSTFVELATVRIMNLFSENKDLLNILANSQLTAGNSLSLNVIIPKEGNSRAKKGKIMLNNIRTLLKIIDETNLESDYPNKLTFLEPVDDQGNITQKMIEKLDEADISFTSFVQQEKNIFALEDMRNVIIFFPKEGLRKNINYSEKIDINKLNSEKELISWINEIARGRSLNFNEACECLFAQKHGTSEIFKINLLKNIDAIFQEGNVLYILTNGIWKKTEVDLSSSINSYIENYFKENEIIDMSVNIDDLIQNGYNIRAENENYWKNDTFWYYEIMFNSSMAYTKDEYLLVDRQLDNATKFELADLYDSINNRMIYVKRKIADNKESILNIRQAVSSFELISRNAPETKNKLEEIGIKINEIKQYALMYIVSEEEYKQLNSSGKLSISNLKDKNLFKYQLLEWIDKVVTTGKEWKVIIVKDNISSNTVEYYRRTKGKK